MSEMIVEVDHSAREHAKFSPSSWKYRAICRRWENHGGTNEAAEEGTLLHERLETGNYDGLNEEQVEAIQKVLKIVTPFFNMEGAQVLREVKLPILGGKSYGTSDLVVVQGPRAWVIDYKFGRRAIDHPKHNWQGVGYLLGVIEKFPEVEEVEVIFIVPRRDEVLRHTFYKPDFFPLQHEVGALLEDLDHREDFEPNPTPAGCEFCKHAHLRGCSALKRLGLATAEQNLPLEIISKIEDFELANPEDVVKVWRLIKVLEKVSETTKQKITEVAETGVEFPGLEWVSKKGNRSITKPNAAWRIVKGVMTPEQMMVASKIQITEFEKLFEESAVDAGLFKTKIEARTWLGKRLVEEGALAFGEGIRYLAESKKSKNNK
jgi:hypothetical protein